MMNISTMMITSTRMTILTMMTILIMIRIAASISLNWKLELIWPDARALPCRLLLLANHDSVPHSLTRVAIELLWQLNGATFKFNKSHSFEFYCCSPRGDLNKVNRCLTRYSPRATTTNRPTNRAPNKPAWHGRNWPKMPNLVVFGQKILFFTGEIKSFVTHITENSPRHLVHIVFWSGIGQNVQ